jgi:type I site-specific restriction endonuclease
MLTWEQGMTQLDPEQQARQIIDAKLEAAGWQVQSRDEMNIRAQLGVAVCEVPMKRATAKLTTCCMPMGKQSV